MHEIIKKSLSELQLPTSNIQIEPYKPFGDLADNFYTIRYETSEVDNLLAYYPKQWGKALLWPLPESGRKPGHGLFLIPHLSASPTDRVVDFGCGQSIFLGLCLKYLGAHSVLNIDKVPAGHHLKSWLDDNVEYLRGDIMNKELLGLDKFDIAITHPPMIPILSGDLKNTNHDIAGPTGREVLDHIITEWSTKLNHGGRFVIGQFDFLGLLAPNGKPPCTSEVLDAAGFDIEQVHTYSVPITPTIESSLNLIKSVYPKYKFEQRDKKMYHKFSVVNARLRRKSN